MYNNNAGEETWKEKEPRPCTLGLLWNANYCFCDGGGDGGNGGARVDMKPSGGRAVSVDYTPLCARMMVVSRVKTIYRLLLLYPTTVYHTCDDGCHNVGSCRPKEVINIKIRSTASKKITKCCDLKR